MREIEYDIDLARQAYNYKACVQSDDLKIILNVYNNSLQYDLTGAKATLNWVKPNSLPMPEVENIAVTGNTISCTLGNTYTDVSGKAKFELEITKDGKITTFPLEIVIVEKVFQSEVVNNRIIELLKTVKIDDAINDFLGRLKEEIIKKADKSQIGSPLIANTVAEMVDKTRVYVYTGTETGYVNGNWYSWDGSAWVSGGTYNSQGIADNSINLAKVNYIPNAICPMIFEGVDTGITVDTVKGTIQVPRGSVLRYGYGIRPTTQSYTLTYDVSESTAKVVYYDLLEQTVKLCRLSEISLDSGATVVNKYICIIMIITSANKIITLSEYAVDSRKNNVLEIASILTENCFTLDFTTKKLTLNSGFVYVYQNKQNYYQKTDASFDFSDMDETTNMLVCYIDSTKTLKVSTLANMTYCKKILFYFSNGIVSNNVNAVRVIDKTFLFIGDSIVYGRVSNADGTPNTDYNPEARMPYPYPAIVGELLGANIYNEGIGGSTVHNSTTGYTGSNPMCVRVNEICEKYKALGVKFNVVVLAGGSNDYGGGIKGKDSSGNPIPCDNVTIWKPVKLGTFDDTTDQTFYGALRKFCGNAVKNFPDSTIIYLTPLHRLADMYPNVYGYKLIDYVNAIKEVCKFYGIIVKDLFSEGGICPTIGDGKTYDGLHPTEPTHKNVIAPKVAGCIRENMFY